ncbi:ABC-three component system protein [Oceanisphaera sp. W20_SRM_FM3]|uniref:ABC-three component system protein n=1 Tax=Oceanisphaera sp. W20_SRM_FM3 TaxID=3240267 RepID=UPI003F959114
MNTQEQDRSLIPNSSKYISGNEIKDNDIGGDLNIGSTVIKLPSYNISVGAESLKALIHEHEKLKEENPIYLYVIEELQSKITDSKSRKVIGLEKKLIKANKEIFLDEALISSQKASKMILRFQNIKSYQIIFNHVLSLIVTRFRAHVVPLIKKGVDDLAIKTVINTVIVEPLNQEVSLAGGYITSDLIEGMLYFLTEKCHVEWV